MMQLAVKSDGWEQLIVGYGDADRRQTIQKETTNILCTELYLSEEICLPNGKFYKD